MDRTVLAWRIPRPLGWLVLGAVVAVPWVYVARQLSNPPAPVQSALHPTAVFWGDRVFTSAAELRAWLHARGVSYDAWANAHPDESAVFEGRRGTPPSTTSEAAPKPAAAQRTAAPEPAATTTAGATATDTTPAPQSPAPAHATTSAPTSHSLLHSLGLIALLLVAALALATGLTPPRELLRLRLVQGPVPVEVRVFAVAAGVTISIVVAAVTVLG
jgi:hypothetical protein